MDATNLLAVLALATLVMVIVFALVSKRKTEQRMNDDDAPKSRLAKDAPDK
ncbi:hypothetical protein [Tateyamaria omphalii]|uniref:hypothetical protein n=1 Tax=Tateyamaria omphalii TaxID=299262 RepID=UPI00156197FB|nr:hypothetical protein [Tateyamaria omphalii]